MEKTRTKPLFYLFFFFLTLSLSGCGYSMHRQSELSFTEVFIGRIENHTVEPKLQDMLHRAITEEFRKQGVSVGSASDNRLTGTVTHFAIAGISEKSGIIAEYRVTVDVEFTLFKGGGQAPETKKVSGPFFVTFDGSGELERVLAGKEAAEEQVMRDIAMQVVWSFLYK
jgi:outer membrane lipopolysaccharide assembly protein LptE/RlpB